MTAASLVRPAERAASGDEMGPVSSGHGGRRDRARRLLLGATLLVGLAATVVAGLVAVAPVEATTSTISWPQAGAGPEPTTAFLVPYRPAELRAAVPCTTLRQASRAAGETTVLATTTTGASSGLAVRIVDGTVRLLVGGRADTLTVPAGDCTLRVGADADGVRVAFDDRPVIDRPGDPVPEVFAITTDLRGDAATGLSFEARTPSWFDNARTPEKSALLGLQFELAGLALVLLTTLGVVDGPFRSRDDRPSALRRGQGLLRRGLAALRRPRTWALAAVDVGVVVGVVWWSVVGPMTDDDGFASQIARAAADGGPVGNYVRWFDASEAPFATSQLVVSLVVDRGVDALTLRLPSVLAGIALWFLVTRGVLPALGQRAGRALGVRLLTVVALGVWWLPYDLGTRPEPLVATGVTAVLVLVLRAVRADARHPLPLLGLAGGGAVPADPAATGPAAPRWARRRRGRGTRRGDRRRGRRRRRGRGGRRLRPAVVARPGRRHFDPAPCTERRWGWPAVESRPTSRRFPRSRSRPAPGSSSSGSPQCWSGSAPDPTHSRRRAAAVARSPMRSGSGMTRSEARALSAVAIAAGTSRDAPMSTTWTASRSAIAAATTRSSPSRTQTSGLTCSAPVRTPMWWRSSIGAPEK